MRKESCLEQFFEEGIFSNDLKEIKMEVAGTRGPALYAVLALIIPNIGVSLPVLIAT
jgi:hypothetical protein